ncbi:MULTISPECIES: hypothetical protein [unclassified Nonomuraea]|uniref:hypothetical protein n=1 Tax=unclassified Nonomuraea TaxID=2593643 RepID=UPI0033FA188D
MASVLTGLQNKELIARETSPVHSKVPIASLTELGRHVLDGAYQEVIVLERALAESFTPTERDTLCELLERATTVLIRQTPNPESRRS